MKSSLLITLAATTLFGCFGTKTLTGTKEDAPATIFDEIRSRIDEGHYEIALELLEFTELHNAQYFYLLSYTYSGLASSNKGELFDIDHKLIEKASEAMEKCLELDPSFSKQLIDNPYDKLSSLWGLLAKRYFFENDREKAQKCLDEGRKRGGFYPAYIEYGYNLLGSCDSFAILLTDRDIDFFSSFYWQVSVDYRTDIDLISLNLLNSPCLVGYYAAKGVDFGINHTFPASIHHQTNPFSSPYRHLLKNAGFEITIPGKATRDKMLAQDVLLVNMINANYREREIYFAFSVSPHNTYAFDEFLRTEGLVRRICADKSEENSVRSLQTLCSNISSNYIFEDLLSETVNLLSSPLLKSYLSVFAEAIDAVLDEKDIETAEKLIQRAKSSLPDTMIAPEQKKDLEALFTRVKTMKKTPKQ